MTVQLSDLQLGDRLGVGAQAEVFKVRNHPELAFKRYLPHALPKLQPSVLVDLVAQSDLTLEGRPISYWATWPTSTVQDQGRIIGFLMPLIPAEFFLSEGKLHGKEGSFSYLATEPAPFWGDVRLPPQEVRLVLLDQLAGILQALHHRRMVIGDISWNNVLWSWSTNGPRALLLDCDGICPSTGTPVSRQLDSPDFDDPLAHPGSTPDADRDCYKFSLLALRVLSRDLNARPTSTGSHGLLDLAPQTEHALEGLLERAAGPVGSRPTATQWRQALQGRSIQTVTPPTPMPRLSSEPKTPPQRAFTPVTPPSASASPASAGDVVSRPGRTFRPIRPFKPTP